jgi:hypothetical protein
LQGGIFLGPRRQALLEQAVSEIVWDHISGILCCALLFHVGPICEIPLSDLGLCYDALLELLGMLHIDYTLLRFALV